MTTTTSVSTRSSVKISLKNILLSCGILSSLFYIAMNIFVPTRFPGYDISAQTVSELSAIGSPTRSLWVTLAAVYTLLVIAFGLGMCKMCGERKSLRITGAILICYAILGLAWPPMHRREVLAAGGGTMTDTLHIVFTIVTVLLMFMAMAAASGSLGRSFRFFTIAVILVMMVFGTLTGLQASALEANLATPWRGVWERISIGAYILWVTVLAVGLLGRN